MTVLEELLKKRQPSKESQSALSTAFDKMIKDLLKDVLDSRADKESVRKLQAVIDSIQKRVTDIQATIESTANGVTDETTAKLKELGDKIESQRADIVVPPDRMIELEMLHQKLMEVERSIPSTDDIRDDLKKIHKTIEDIDANLNSVIQSFSTPRRGRGSITLIGGSGGAGTASGTVLAETAFSIAATAGTSSEFSRGDHTHGSPDDLVSGTAHATLTTGIHGLGSMAGASSADYLLKQMAENDPLLLDASLSGTGQYSGIAITGTSDAALAFGQVCYIAAGSTRWGLAAATAASGVQRIGMCVGAATGAADTTTILLYGNVLAAALTCCTLAASGSSVFISNTAGSAIITAPTAGSSIVRVIGHSVAASAMLFAPDGTWIKLA